MSDRTSDQIRREMAARLYGEIGCKDPSCVFGGHGGMHLALTCLCLQTTDPEELRRIAWKLAEVSRALCLAHILR